MTIQVNIPLTFLFKWYQAEIWVKEVVKLVASILPIVGLFQVFDGWSAVTAGILRAKGKQVRLADFISKFWKN